MATKEQLAILGELRRRRDSLSPERQAIVDELGRRWSPQEQTSEAPRTLGGFASNVVTSGVGLLEPFLSPVQTGKGTAYSLFGLIEKMSGGRPEHKYFTQYADAVGRELVNRYGSWEAVKKTAYEDPAGLTADIAGLVAGGGGALRTSASLAGKAGVTASTVSKLGQTGKAVQSVGRAMEPLGLGLRTVRAVPDIPYAGQVVKAPAHIASEVLGVLTGVGGEPIRTAARRPSKALTDALRGRTGWMEIVGDVKESVQTIRSMRGEQYRTRMREVFDQDKVLNLNGVRGAIAQRLKDNFRVTMKMRYQGSTPKPEFIFEGSTISKQNRKDVGDLLTEVFTWKDYSPEGVDALRRLADDYYIPAGEANALTSFVRRQIVNKLNKELPGYHELTAGYRDATNLINMVTKELSISPDPGSTIRKLSNALNSKTGYRQTIIEAIDQYIPEKPIKEQLSGAALHSLVPQGIMRPLTGGAILVSGAGGSFGPLDALMASATSPRLVGEMMVGLSRLRRSANAITTPFPPEVTRPAYYGAGAYRDVNPVSVKFPDQEPPEHSIIP